MSTYDHYDPGVVECPDCGAAISNWTGKDGPGRFFPFRLGARQPVDQLVDEDSRTPTSEWPRFRLPQTFFIEAWGDRDGHTASATGVCDSDGAWSKTWLHHASWSGCQPGGG